MPALDLTPGERLLICRLRAGWTQTESAKAMGVSRKKYGAAERDEITLGSKVHVGRLDDHEKLIVYRKRAEMTQERVARKLGISRFWYNLLEQGNGDCSKALEFFQNRE